MSSCKAFQVFHFYNNQLNHSTDECQLPTPRGANLEKLNQYRVGLVAEIQKQFEVQSASLKDSRAVQQASLDEKLQSVIRKFTSDHSILQ